LKEQKIYANFQIDLVNGVLNEKKKLYHNIDTLDFKLIVKHDLLINLSKIINIK